MNTPKHTSSAYPITEVYNQPNMKLFEHFTKPKNVDDFIAKECLPKNNKKPPIKK